MVDESDVLILACRAPTWTSAIGEVKGLDKKVVFNAVKGLVTDDHHIPARYLNKVLGVPYGRIGLISGPSHAEEVARENWTYLTLACPNERLAERMADRMRTSWFRTETTDDLFGIELAAVLKNIYAVAAGIAHGLGLGDNFIAVMMSNALQETRGFLHAINETARDVNSSAYMGDLLVTAYSPHSRNRRLGTMVGRGYRVTGALIEMDMVAEGYPPHWASTRSTRSSTCPCPWPNASTASSTRRSPRPSRCASSRTTSIDNLRPARNDSVAELVGLMVRFLMTLFLLSAGTLSAQVRFVPNEGQWPDHIHHRAEVVGGGVQLERAGWLCWQWAPETEAVLDHHKGARRGIVWQAEWIDADPLAALNWVRSGFASDREHHYLSDDPDQWAEHIQPVSMLKTENVWPGIRLRWRGTRQGRAAFEFTVAPGADPNDIGWRYRGVRPAIGPDGELHLQHAQHDPDAGFMAELASPFAFQWREDGHIDEVPCRYILDGPEVRFEVGAYDGTRPLVIDPEITFSTYAGSTGDNFGTTASNGPGGALVGGAAAFAPGYPTTADAVEATMDVFADGISHTVVTVFSPDGTNLLYSTYLGGSHADIPHSLAYNETWGNIVLFGTTGSSNFPTTPGVVQPDLAPGPATDVDIYGVDTQPNGVDCYLASFNGVDFTLEAATYFGGSGNDGQNKAAGLNANFGDEYRGQIDIGPDGSIWIATTTTSQDLNLPGSPAPAGSYDALVAGFSADLSTLLCGRTFGGFCRRCRLQR